MFLAKVYKHSRWMFATFAGFAILQLGVFSRAGMVFSPFFNYGMYSAPMPLDTTYCITNFAALKASAYTPQQWDKVQVTLQRFNDLAQNDSLYHQHILRLFAKAHLPTPSVEKFTMLLPQEQFQAWFRQYIKRTISLTPVKINLGSTTALYRWNGERLAPEQ